MKKYLSITIAIIVLFFCACDKNPFSFIRTAIFEFPTEAGPIAIALDEKHGIIYVASSYSGRSGYNRKIQTFSTNGTFLRTIIDFAQEQNGSYSNYVPIDFTLDDEHNLYVLVRPHCVLKYNSEGNFQKKYDFQQTDERPFFSACAFYRGFIYVTNGSVIKKINSKTGQTYDFPLPFDEIDQTLPMIHTSDIAIDSKGNIWLAGQAYLEDHQNRFIRCHVTKLDPTCKYSTTYYSKGSTGRYGAMLNNPGIDIDKKGNIYLATFYCQSVEVFSNLWIFLKQIDVNEENENNPRPIDVIVGNGIIYVLDYSNNLVRLYPTWSFH